MAGFVGAGAVLALQTAMAAESLLVAIGQANMMMEQAKGNVYLVTASFIKECCGKQ